MKNKLGPDKVAMFVDCKVVGRSKFYKDGKTTQTPKFSKAWKADTPGTC